MNVALIDDVIVVVSRDGDYWLLHFMGKLDNGTSFDESEKQPIAGGKIVPVGNSDVHHGSVKMRGHYERVLDYYSD